MEWSAMACIGWGYLPDKWQWANVACPLFLRQGRVNDGGGRMGLGMAT